MKIIPKENPSERNTIIKEYLNLLNTAPVIPPASKQKKIKITPAANVATIKTVKYKGKEKKGSCGNILKRLENLTGPPKLCSKNLSPVVEKIMGTYQKEARSNPKPKVLTRIIIFSLNPGTENRV